MTTYNGHRNWDYWNVSLWINNDEGLYNLARDCVRRNKTRTLAAQEFVFTLDDVAVDKTPDGAVYTVNNVRAAMVGM